MKVCLYGSILLKLVLNSKANHLFNKRAANTNDHRIKVLNPGIVLANSFKT